MLRQKTKIVEHVSVRYMGWLVTHVFHVSSPRPNAPSLASNAALPFQIPAWASHDSFSRNNAAHGSHHQSGTDKRPYTSLAHPGLVIRRLPSQSTEAVCNRWAAHLAAAAKARNPGFV